MSEKIPKRHAIYDLILKKPNQLIEWYEKTDPKRRKNIYISLFIRHIIYPLAFISFVVSLYNVSRSDENPITGRETVYSMPTEFSEILEKDCFEDIFMKHMSNGSFIPSTHPLVKRLDNCVERLVSANNDIEMIGSGIWSPVVIDEDICDVIVLKETQNIFVYKKIFDLCESDDELAYVLAHQLAHSLLEHRREPITNSTLLYRPLLMILPTLLWVISDEATRFDIFRTIDDFLINQIKYLLRKIIQLLPYNEELEEEADRIAMQLMTRSCFDIRKCRQFCKKYKHLSQTDDKEKSIENNNNNNNDLNSNDFFRKHPITDQKLLYLFQYIKPFIDLRKQCNCQPLK